MEKFNSYEKFAADNTSESLSDIPPNNSLIYESNRFRTPQRAYDGKDRVFAVFAVVLGFFIVKTTIAGFQFKIGLAESLVLISLTFFNFFYCKSCGFRITQGRIAVIGLLAVLSMSCMFTNNYDLKWIMYWFVIAANLYTVYTAYDKNKNSVLYNAVIAIIVSPFEQFGSVFGALFHKNENTKKKKGNVGYVIIGLGLSIPVSCLVASILMDGDERFTQFFRIFQDKFTYNFQAELLTLLLSTPIFMYLFSAVYSRKYRKINQSTIVNITPMNFRVIPSAMCNAFLVPISLIYVLFMIVQISYFFTTFFGIDSSSFDYAEYAREGFFQLCAVTVINLTLSACAVYFTKIIDINGCKKVQSSVRRFLILFSALTLCLIATALTKMFMYISMYGFTPRRVYTSVFMFYLFVMFIILIVKQVRWELSFTKCAFFLASAILILISFLPVDGFIAKYNIDKYEQGEIEWMGQSALYQLDCSAIKYLAPLYDKNEDVNKYFDGRYYGDIDIYNFDVHLYEASKIIESYNNK